MNDDERVQQENRRRQDENFNRRNLGDFNNMDEDNEEVDVFNPNVKPVGKGWFWDFRSKNPQWRNNYVRGLGPWWDAGNRPDSTKSKIHGVKSNDVVTYGELETILGQPNRYIKKMENKGKKNQN